MKVSINQPFYAKVMPLTPAERTKPLSSMDDSVPELAGGSRCRAGYADAINRRYICELCHVAYPSKYQVAYFLGSDCKVALTQKETIRLIADTEAILGKTKVNRPHGNH